MFIVKYLQKLPFGIIAIHVFKKIFLILLFSCIVFFKTVDNESICGDVGENEIHCFFSKSYTDGEGHVCIQCPCNTVVLSSLPEIPRLIYNYLYIYSFLIFNLYSPNTNFEISLFRPPKILISLF